MSVVHCVLCGKANIISNELEIIDDDVVYSDDDDVQVDVDIDSDEMDDEVDVDVTVDDEGFDESATDDIGGDGVSTDIDLMDDTDLDDMEYESEEELSEYASDDSDDDVNVEVDVDTDDDDDDSDKDGEEEAGCDSFRPLKNQRSSTARMIDIAQEQKDTTVRFIRAGSRNNLILAFVGDLCVARLPKKALSSEVQTRFSNDAYLKGIRTSYASMGLEKTLTDFKFTPITMQVSNNNARKNIEKKAVEQANSKIQENQKKFRKEFEQCIGIAAAGMNKGFWRDEGHPVKQQLFDTLNQVGVRNPQVPIETAFASSGDLFCKQMIDKAFDIMKKPVDVRNSMAEAIGEAQYVSETAAYDDPEEDFDTSTLEASMKPTKTIDTEISTDNDKKSIQEIRASITGPLFQREIK